MRLIRHRPNHLEAAIAITLRFGPADLMRCRFAISPVLETVQAVRLTAPDDLPGHHQGFLDSIKHRLAALDLSPLALLQPRRGYSPDFLTPPPGNARPRFDDELARIEATPMIAYARRSPAPCTTPAALRARPSASGCWATRPTRCACSRA